VSSIKKNFIYNSVLSISRIIFPLISFPYSSRILGPNGVGKVNFIDSYTQYFCLLAALGIPLYGVREVAKYRDQPDKLQTLTSELLVLNFLASLVMCLFFFLIAFLTGRFKGEEVLYLLGAANLLLSAFPAEWFFQGLEKFRYITVRSFLLNFLSVALLFILVKSPGDIEWYYGITVVTMFINVVINMQSLIRTTRLQFRGLNMTQHVKPLLLLFSTQVAISVYVVLDKVILGYLAADEYVGYYASSLKITKILLTMISALAIVMMPQMSKAFGYKDNEKARQLYEKSANFVTTVAIPISMGLMCLADEIIILASGKAFLPAAMSLKLTAPIIYLIGMNNIFGLQILTASGKEKTLLRCILIATVVNLVTNFTLIPVWLHNGASVAILLTELVVVLTTGYFGCKLLNIKVNWKQIFLTIVACLPFFGIHFAVRSENIIMTILLTTSISGLYYLVMQIAVFRNDLWKSNFLKMKNYVYGKV